MSLFGNMSSTMIEDFDKSSLLSYGVFKNGLWRRTTTSLGVFTHKVKDLDTNMGLNKECSFDFEQVDEIPKIPYSIYFEILSFYQRIYKEIKSEVYTCIVWDKVKKDFFIHVPKQTVSGAEVKFENDPAIISNPDVIPYCDIHSHNVMNAFFSSGDIKDEVSGRFFGVIGTIDTTPSSVFKIAYNRQFKDLTVEEVFDLEKEKLYETSDYTIKYEEAITKVTERVAKVSSNFKSRVAKPVKNLPAKTSYPATYDNLNVLDNYDYDYYLEDGWDTWNDSSSLLIGTSIKEYSQEYMNFKYDFKRVFGYSPLKVQETVNLYHSIAVMMENHKRILTEEAFNNIVNELAVFVQKNEETK